MATYFVTTEGMIATSEIEVGGNTGDSGMTDGNDAKEEFGW